MTRFTNLAEINAEKAENLKAFSGIKLLHIKNHVSDILSLIGRNDIFDQYTKHDITHVNEMLKILEWLITEETMNTMTHADWLMLVLSIYFHDMGMLVTKSEFDNRNNTDFVKYKGKIDSGEFGLEFKKQITALGEESEKFMYQEYIRANHAIRIKNWICGISSLNLGESQDIVNELNKLLGNIDGMFKRDLAKICESHHLNDLDDFTKYKTCVRYGNSDDEAVNLHYISIILRTVDLLHITSDRTPSIQYRLINPSNPKSIIEWKKQMAVKAVRPKPMVNEEGNVDVLLPQDTIEVTAYFDQPDQAEAFFGLSSYLIYARKEIRHSYDLIQQSIKTQGSISYNFPWKNINDENIQTFGFERKLLQFNLDQNNILHLLVGHTLYNDSSVVLRELVQNGLDAIKLQNKIESDNKVTITKGCILIEWDNNERTLSIIDNGTGMSISDIEKYLLNVGSSKYRSEEFLKKYPDFSAISRFGIGILTCFLIANNIDIITNSPDEETANMISIRELDGKYLLKKLSKIGVPSQIKNHGTKIILYVRPEVEMSNLGNDLRKWIIFPYCEVVLQINKSRLTIGYSSPKVALENYMKKRRYQLDYKKFKIIEDELDGVTIAYPVTYSEYLKEWDFISSKNHVPNEDENEISPFGTCIEGIRIEFDTPGYNTKNIIAIANITGTVKIKTNVARSAIEVNDEKKTFLSIIYKLFSKHIQNQIDCLKDNGYSLAWATSESKYLINPLLPHEGKRDYIYRGNDEKIEPQDVDLLFSALDEIRCMIIEKDSGRENISPKDVMNIDAIYIVDSKMIRAAESLLKEIETNTTLCNLINTISEDEDNKFINMNNVICNYDRINIMHKRALDGKQVARIDVLKKQRRINLLYKNNTSLWHTFNLFDRRDITIHIPISDFKINGLTNELGVKTIDGIYLSSSHEFTQYILHQLHLFDYLNNREDYYLLIILISTIFSQSSLEAVSTDPKANAEEIFDSIFDRNNAGFDREFAKKLWTKINKNELLVILLKEQYFIYDPTDWSRNINEN